MSMEESTKQDIPNGNLVAMLVRPPTYRASRPNVFPSDESFNWFKRKHRQRLVAEGAILIIAGRTWIVPDKCDQCVLLIGAAKASA